MSVRTKLLCVMLLVGASAVAITGFLGYEAGRRSLTQAAMSHLTGIRRTKALQIESYFRSVRGQVRILRQGPTVLNAMFQFRTEFQKLDGPETSPEHRSRLANHYVSEYLPRLHTLVDPRSSFDQYLPSGRGAYILQLAWIVNNPFPTGRKKELESTLEAAGYSAVHLAYHKAFSKITEELGCHDLLLVDPASGRIVYSVQKDVDFGTSLYYGPYRSTACARAVVQARNSTRTDDVILTDFEMFEPALGAPAAFATAPIRDDSGLIGVLAIQLTNKEIDRVISGDRSWEREGLGKSGDSGIVGADYLMRSNARGFLQNPEVAIQQMRAREISPQVIARIRAYNSTVLQQVVRLPSVDAAIRGEEGTRIQVGSAGRQSIVSYGPLQIPGLRWTIGSRMDVSEALEPVYRLRRAVIWWAVLAMAATSCIALLLTQAILGPVNRLVSAARRVAACDYRARVPVRSKDELGLLSKTFNDMVDSIREKTEIIERQNRDNERLLLNILPKPIALRLRNGETRIADAFPHVSVLFADIVGFTSLAASSSPGEMVALLNDLFTRFDNAAGRAGVEKIKTIGDAYMAVAGLPVPYPDHIRGWLFSVSRCCGISRSSVKKPDWGCRCVSA